MSPIVSSELQNKFSEFATKFNAAEEKNHAARHALHRMDELADTLADVRVGLAKLTEVAQTSLATAAKVMTKVESLDEKIDKHRRSTMRLRRAVGEVAAENHAMWQVIRKHGERLDVLEQAREADEQAARDAEQQEVGKRALINKGKALAAAGGGVAVGVVSNWSKVLNWIRGHV